MTDKEVAILDFGSQKISVLVGARDVNNTINVKCTYQENYEGFMDGEFIEPSKLDDVIFSCISGAEKMCDMRIKKIVVGVPTEFCFSVCKNVSKTFLKQKRITKNDIDLLFDSVDIPLKTHTIINRGSVYYILGESNKVKKIQGDNLLSGTYLTSGEVYILIEKVGEDNYINQLSKKSKEFKCPKSKLFTQINNIFTRQN